MHFKFNVVSTTTKINNIESLKTGGISKAQIARSKYFFLLPSIFNLQLLCIFTSLIVLVYNLAIHQRTNIRGT